MGGDAVFRWEPFSFSPMLAQVLCADTLPIDWVVTADTSLFAVKTITTDLATDFREWRHVFL